MSLFFHRFAALYLSSNLVSARTGEGGFKQKADRGREGAENWQKYADSLYG